VTTPEPRGTEAKGLEAAARLTGALEGMTAELAALGRRQDALVKYGHRNRFLIWLTFASVAISVTAMVLLILVNAAAQSAASQSAANTAAISAQHQNQVTACRLANQSRAQQVTVWTRVLGLTNSNVSTRTVKGRQLLAFIREVDERRDCNSIYRLP
jgi:hypothetical protein